MSVDFCKLVNEMLEKGMTQQKIADACGVGQAAISAIADGRTNQPLYNTGYQLIHLHKKVMRRVGK